MEINQKIEQVPSGAPPIFPVIEPGHSFGSITDKISGIVLTPRTPLFWFLIVGISGLVFGVLLYAMAFLFYQGVGIWGVNVPVAWGLAITNFVWWIGIG